MKKIILCLIVSFVVATAAHAEEVISLPKPLKNGGPALLDCLAARQASRDFAGVVLTPQQLSDLLWATGGVNREDGRLTYPTAMNVQDIIIYAMTGEGVYRYDPMANALIEIERGDFRAETGMQPFAAEAAVNLAFVQDRPAWGKLPVSPSEEDILRMSSIHVGEAAQNAALYAASQNWAAVVRGSFDQEKMSARLKLNDSQSVIIVQSIGPKK